MGKMVSATVFSVCIMVSSFATGGTWFDAGIAGYQPSMWPDSVAQGAGTWSGAENTFVVQTNGVSHLDVYATLQNPLEFAPLQPRSIDEEEISAEFVAKFSAIWDSALLPAPDEIKCGITVMEKDGIESWYGVVADAAGGTNSWAALSGKVPNPDKDVSIRVLLRTVDGVRQVKYEADGATLASTYGEWSPLALRTGGSVSGFAFTGSGDVAYLAAETSAQETYRVLTVPEAFDYMTLVSVKANGKAVDPEDDGTYMIPDGASVTATFSRNAGSFIDRAAMVFTMDGDMTLPENGRPRTVSPSTLLSINEIMASNDGTLKTRNGKSGLDWIEIRNKADYDIDITGWYLSDNPDKAQSKWKKIKGSAIVPAKGFKIVWAEKDYKDFADSEAYTETGLSSSGETVFLATPEGDNVHSVEFGVSIKDISVGTGTRYRTLVGRNAAAEWRADGAGKWISCTGPLAATNAAAAGFTVVSRVSPSVAPVTNVCAAITSAAGVQGGNAELLAFGTVLIPRAGKWTFKCGGRGNSIVVFSRGGVEWTLENTWAVFSFPEAGAYDVTLTCTAVDGAAAPELLFMEGEPPESGEGAGAEPNADSLELTPVGEGEIAHAAPYAAQLAAGTDVSDAVRETGAFEWRTAFNLDAAPGENAQLRICYADGFTASVNGRTFASVSANGPRAKPDAVQYETFAVPAAYLASGENTLQISVQDDAGGDREMFLATELLLPDAAGGDKVYYFLNPTPGAANDADAKDGPTPKVGFSVPHGYKTEPFTLELSCAEAPDAAIYYTLDGTAPDASKTLYTGPIEISRTTVVRAAVPNANAVLQYDTSATYLFVEDILAQKDGPAGFPAGSDTGCNQVSTTVNGQNLKYGMRSDVVAKYRANILNGFTNGIDTVSLVVDPSGLFNSSTGIYVNAMNDGRAWERHVVFEMFSATNASAGGITVPAGLRIRGGMSRQGGCRKHALRLFFRSEYGENKLEYKLFGDEGVDTFDKIDLRTAQNHSWELGGNRDFTLVEDVFSRDCQRDMGQSYHRSRYYHLFINGAYWGLYQTEERTDGHFGEYYFGGDDEDWDVVRTSHSSGVIDYKTGVVDGEKTGWTNFWDITVNQGYSGAYASNYNKVMGLNPDGTRNPDYPIYLNPTNLAVYMLTAHFTNDQDCPAYRLHPNNIAMLRNRYDDTKSFNGISGAGWIFHRHDAELSLGYGDYGAGNFGCFWWGTEEGHANFRALANFNPAEMHYKLEGNPEYRMLVADLVFRHFIKEDGAMTVEAQQRRFHARMDELGDAISCESARWGDPSNRNPATWTNACNKGLVFIQNQMTPFIGQYRSLGWYPSVDAPRARNIAGECVYGGMRNSGNSRITLASGSAGTIYYTLDGTDPRSVGGKVDAAAQEYGDQAIEIPEEGASIRARLLSGSGEWSALESVDIAVPSAASRGLRIAEVMSSTADGGGDGSEYIVLTNLLANESISLAGVRVTCAKPDKAPSLDLTLADGLSIPAAGAVKLAKSEMWPDAKITNGAVDILLYDIDGDIVQTGHVDASWYDKVCDGNGAGFVALEFGSIVTEASQWKPYFSSGAQYAAAMAGAFGTDAKAVEWMNGLLDTAEGRQAAVAFFADPGATEKALYSCYLANVPPEPEPEIELAVTSISFDNAGRIVIGAGLSQHGVRKTSHKVNGSVKLLKAATLEALEAGEAETEDLGAMLPVEEYAVQRGQGVNAGFFQLRIE